MIEVETLCGASEDDPLRSGVDIAFDLIPKAEKATFPGEAISDGLKTKADMIKDFLES